MEKTTHNHGIVRIHNVSGQSHTIKDFLPLIGIIVVVGVLTTVSVWQFAADPMLAFMGWFFLVFGALKVLRIHDFVVAYKEYDIVAEKSTTYAYIYPFLELGFGLSYLFVWKIQPVSAVVVLVMLIGAYGVFRKLRKKEEVPCACLGTVFKVPMTWVTLVEDLLMAGMALIILV